MKKFLLFWSVLFVILFMCTPVMSWEEPSLPITIREVAPTVNDDNFTVPFLWTDTVADKNYILVDNTTGAAVWQEVMVAGGTIGGDLIPTADNTYDIGSTTKEWKDLYVDGIANLDTVDIDGNTTIQPATDSTTAVQILDADGGTPVLNVDTTNERIGIGLANPAYDFQIKSHDSTAFSIIGKDDSNQIVTMGECTDKSGSICCKLSNVTKARLQAKGDSFVENNFGIGTGTPEGLLEVNQVTTGLGTVSVNDVNVVGTNTQFLNTFKVGDTITANGETRTIATITDDTHMTTTLAWTTTTNKSYTLVGGSRMAVLGNGNVGIGTTSPNQLFTIEGTMSLKEQASANADTAAYGQIWVKTATPNELWFTDDAGTDVQLGVSTFDATTVDAVTWSDGANASNVWTFDVSGTDTTITFGDGSVAIAGALTATSYGGITEANLVDKSASETISGTWEFARWTSFSFGNDTYNVAPFIKFDRSRDGDPTSNVADGDWLGDIRFFGNYDSSSQAGAYIAAVVDGTPGSSPDMPTELIFQTSPDSSATPMTRMSIKAAGDVVVSPDGTNTVFQVSDGTIGFTDGNAGTTGTLTVDSSGNWSYDKNIVSTGNVAGATYGSDGSITNAELLYVNTLSSNAQTQLDTKAPEYQTMSVMAGAMIPCTTSGAETGTNEYGTNDIDVDYLAFDGGATEERAQFTITMPENWDRGTVKVKFYWTNATGASASDTVEWGIKAGALGDDDAIDAALGTAVTISDTLIADGDLQISSATAAMTVGGTPALGDMLQFEVYRNTDGTDDMEEDAWLLGCVIQYKVDKTVSAW